MVPLHMGLGLRVRCTVIAVGQLWETGHRIDHWDRPQSWQAGVADKAVEDWALRGYHLHCPHPKVTHKVTHSVARWEQLHFHRCEPCWVGGEVEKDLGGVLEEPVVLHASYPEYKQTRVGGKADIRFAARSRRVAERG